MIVQGYFPDFFNQEFVEKILFENFPFLKINDVTAFHCMNFHELAVTTGEQSDLSLYYGYISSYDGSSLTVYALDLYSSVRLFDFDSFYTPLLLLGLSSSSVPSFFTGWKISAVGLVFSINPDSGFLIDFDGTYLLDVDNSKIIN